MNNRTSIIASIFVGSLICAAIVVMKAPTETKTGQTEPPTRPGSTPVEATEAQSPKETPPKPEPARTVEPAFQPPGGPAAVTAPGGGASRRRSKTRIPNRGPGFRFMGHSDLQYGKPRLIALIEGVSRRMQEELRQLDKFRTAGLPNAELSRTWLVLGDGNTRGGRKARGHLSHHAGTSIDIGYFYRESGRSGVKNEFRNHRRLPTEIIKETLVRHGEEVEWPKRYLTRLPADWDLMTNWMFVQQLLEAPEARVTAILVDPIYASLLESVAPTHLSGKALARALRVIQADGNHDNHFHVEIGG